MNLNILLETVAWWDNEITHKAKHKSIYIYIQIHTHAYIHAETKWKMPHDSEQDNPSKRSTNILSGYNSSTK